MGKTSVLGKTSLSVIILHLYFLTYIGIAYVGASPTIMLFLHLASIFVVIPATFFMIKSGKFFNSLNSERESNH
ncbi:MAG: hypothetical protein H7Y07_06415 [Pyrinomonadaceae bacterium]|nr:hypothetical protein [Sphingobacteriaceae bacterium]